MFLTILAHTQHDVIRRLPAQKVHRSDIFLASFTLPRQSGIFSIFPFFWIDVHEWQHLVTSKHIYHWHWNTILVVISKIFGKKQNIIVTFQSGQLTEQSKTTSIWNFILAIYLYCFYHRLALYAEYFTTSDSHR
jgi:hypothetical protein